VGSLGLLIRWIWRATGMIRLAQVSPADRPALPYSLYLGLFPLLFFVHNFMESSYFTANSVLGPLLLMVGIALDLAFVRQRRLRREAQLANRRR